MALSLSSLYPPSESTRKCEEKLRRLIGTAVVDYGMIEDGDKILVACSGGKDSTVLLLLLNELKRRSPVSFTLHPVMLDQKQPGFDASELKYWFAERNLELTIIEEDTYSIVTDTVAENKTYCSLCSRLRRGVLYNYADEKGYTKIALGHHRDDVNETLLLNLFFEGTIASMPPMLCSKDERNTVIRPLCLVPESLIIEYADAIGFPIVPCKLCGSQENLQREQIKELLGTLEAKNPAIGASMLGAIKNVKPSHLMDKRLFEFGSAIDVADTAKGNSL